MLSEEQKQGCAEILRMLEGMDLMSLCDTVTGKLVAPETEEEAIDAIIRYSNSAVELLNRKKLRHEIMFQYLHWLNVEGVSPRSTKAEFVAKILGLWRKNSDHANEKQEPCSSNHDSQHSPLSTPALKQGPLVTSNISINHTTVINHEVKNFTAIIAKPQDDTGQRMAQEFINWFFPMLNSLQDSNGAWGVQHFWPNACLNLKVVNEANQTFQERFEGADATQEKLASLVMKERVIFNPNTTPEGYRGAVSPHGLAKVAVSGTLHKLNANRPQEFAGIFEQCFGLLRDINDENRWKMKYSDLKIQIAASNFGGQSPQIPLSEEAAKAVFERE